MVNLNFLPVRIVNALNKTDTDTLSELRLRTDFPIFGIFKGKKAYLSDEGATLDRNNALICRQGVILETVVNATERSLYAFNDRLKQGFITTRDGVRIGVAGECVFDNDRIITIKKISSLNIRVPHEIKNCSAAIYNKIFSHSVYNTLLVSPPAKGKTTILKDLARKLNDNTDYSVLIIDERGEFNRISGENIDLIKYSNKIYALSYAIRSMSPNIVITDELQSKEDWQSAEQAAYSGVKIVASCHGKDIEDLKSKDFFNKNVFERYVVIDADKSAGSVKGIYDKDFNII
nr:hypothetical protein [Clostridia bacterium]